MIKGYSIGKDMNGFFIKGNGQARDIEEGFDRTSFGGLHNIVMAMNWAYEAGVTAKLSNIGQTLGIDRNVTHDSNEKNFTGLAKVAFLEGYSLIQVNGKFNNIMVND